MQANCTELRWGLALEELQLATPHIHLLEYPLTVTERLGLISDIDREDPHWMSMSLNPPIMLRDSGQPIVEILSRVS